MDAFILVEQVILHHFVVIFLCNVIFCFFTSGRYVIFWHLSVSVFNNFFENNVYCEPQQPNNFCVFCCSLIDHCVVLSVGRSGYLQIRKMLRTLLNLESRKDGWKSDRFVLQSKLGLFSCDLL